MNALEARVRAINKAHAIANELHPILTAVFSQHLGCKILKVDGSLLAAIQKQVESVLAPYEKRARIHRGRSNYTLNYTVNTCESDSQGHAKYYDIGVYIGEFENAGAVLTKLMPHDKPLKTDYTVEDVLEARRQYKEAKELADHLQSALWPFGENDR